MWIYEEVMKKLYGFISRLQLLCNGVRDTSEFMASFQIGFRQIRRTIRADGRRTSFLVYITCERPPKSSDILEQSHQDIDT